MEQTINHSASNFEAFNIGNANNYIEEQVLSFSEKAQKNNELQIQAGYLNRVLEAYSDCV